MRETRGAKASSIPPGPLLPFPLTASRIPHPASRIPHPRLPASPLPLPFYRMFAPSRVPALTSALPCNNPSISDSATGRGPIHPLP